MSVNNSSAQGESQSMNSFSLVDNSLIEGPVPFFPFHRMVLVLPVLFEFNWSVHVSSSVGGLVGAPAAPVDVVGLDDAEDVDDDMIEANWLIDWLTITTKL